MATHRRKINGAHHGKNGTHQDRHSKPTALGMAPEDLEILKKEKIQFLITKLGLTKQRATAWAERTVQVIKQVELELSH